MSQVKDGLSDITSARQSQGKFHNPSQSLGRIFSFLEFLPYPVPVISLDSFMVCGTRTCSSCQYKMESYVPLAWL
jgi:hypothetical protein